MRSPVRKQLAAAFEREFKRRYPGFSLIKLSDRSALKIWAWAVAPHLTFYVVLSPFEDEDAFAVEIAWSENGEFPWASFGQVDIEVSSLRERLGRLWAREGAEPVWDAATEVATTRQARFDATQRDEEVNFPLPPSVDVVISRIAPLVDDCLQKFHEHAVPVFNLVAQHRGLGEVFAGDDA